ncbi:caspase-9 isoform X2 [Eublepharis macularius]|uniref:Caspase-9 isoform X2 n=1 Tax=Eublepharis macularius TaxID=481883 RepID=A0AA97KMI3_EUBMA|nr:caspase-9 isoform X2 [Eublepharis macularius]
MEEAQRQVLQRSRVRLVKELQVEPLWDLLVHRGIFTQDMVEEIQRCSPQRKDTQNIDSRRSIMVDSPIDAPEAISYLQRAGTRRDQARQLITDLQTRGKEALPTFIWCLRETGQNDLAALLGEGCSQPQLRPVNIEPIVIHSYAGRVDEGIRTSEYLPSPAQERFREPIREITATQGSVAERDARNHDMVYAVKSDPCGYCLIINNVNFTKESGHAARIGSDVDCQRLERRFRRFRFEVLTRRDLRAQTSHIQFPGGIYGADGMPIAVEKIVSYFNGSNCPCLRGKPKLFFIQACGGKQMDRGFEVDSEPSVDQRHESTLDSDASPFQIPAGDPDEPDAVASLPTPSDILVSYSTFPGFVSWRDKQSGSWYVETLDQILDQFAHSEDLLTMLLRVANAVSAKGKYKQMPGCFNFLRKRFLFMTE